jgi:BASS family bile acid:Na+ symporter
MDLRQIVVLALQISIVAMVFGFGLKATSDDLLYVVRRPGLLARSLVAMLVVMPVVAIVLVRTFDFTRTVEIVLVALAISPVPPLLPNRERAAGAAVSYGLGLMVTLGVLSILAVPLAVSLLERIFGLPLGMSPAAIARLMLTMLVGPVVVGVALRALAPGFAARVARPVNRLAIALLVLGALVLLVATAPAIWGLLGDATVLALAIFVSIGLAVGHVLGGPDPDHAGVLALSTACRHPIIAMTIAATNFPGERFGATIILYLLVNIVLSIPYIAWQKKRVVAAAAPA